MKLIFGVACDGPSYPDFPGEGEGVFDAAVVGPAGLLDELEIQLGLTRPRIAHAVRIACYSAKLRIALGEVPDLFFASSFALDPWATASALLDWRDQLVAAGWDCRAVSAERPDALAMVETAGAALPAGIPDRLCALCSALASGAQPRLARIDLVEPRHLLPSAWRRLLEAIEARGVTIVETPAAAPCALGDLGRVQAFLAGQGAEPLAGDGSFVLVGADTALMAAEALAEWLAHAPEADLRGTVIVSPDGDTALLDTALQARGLPALGQSAASPWRGALQVLPLAFAAAWAPLDAKAMLDLLIMPRPPVPRRVARPLAYALSREPGLGGTAWNAAWEAIKRDEAARAEAEGKSSELADRIARWREWTEGGSHPRSKGMPAEAARAIALRVARWASETDAGCGDPLFLTTFAVASDLAQAIDLLGLEMLPALLLERMIDQVLADGARNPDHVATAGGLRCVCSPAAIWSSARHVVWWDFKGPGERVPALPWSREELAALGEVGCRLDPPSTAAARIGWSGANPARRGSERLLLITPALSGADKAVSHPLAHQLEPLIGSSRPKVSWTAEQLLETAEHDLAGRQLQRETICLVQPPRARAGWALPAAARGRLDARTENASSFERLADCQMRWLLLDVFRLSRGRIAEIPGADQLLGNLAHDLASLILEPGPAPDPAAVETAAAAAFEERLDAIASPLRQPEHAGELVAARVRVPAALSQLAHLLRERGAEIVGTELERDAQLGDGLAVNGRLDLVVRQPEAGLGVVDLKWTRSARRRRTELADGRAIQLATYGAIVEADGPPATGAYYLLAQKRLIAPEGSFLADEPVEGMRSLEETWLDIVAAWREWRRMAQLGTIVATGATGAEELLPADLPVSPCAEPCRFCELTRLCRVAVVDL